MPFLNSIEIIPYEVWIKLQDDYDTEHLVLVPAENNLKVIRNQIRYKEPVFSVIWENVKAYLAFPYVQLIADDTTHIDSQIINRIGSIYSALGKAKNELVVDFLKHEIGSFLEIFRESGKVKNGSIEMLEPLSKEEVTNRVDSEGENYDFVNDGSLESENDDGYIIKYLVLKSNPQNDPNPNPHLHNSAEDIREKIVSQRHFFRLIELGIIDYLQKRWQWIDGDNENEKEINLHHRTFELAEVLAKIFLFPNAGTLRTYIVKYNKQSIYDDSKYYSEGNKKKVRKWIKSLGIKERPDQ